MLNPSQIKAVAVDCDGTLINSKELLSPYTAEVIKALVQTGREAYMVTGRGTHAALPYALEAGIPEFIITYNGGVLWDILQKKALVEHLLPREIFMGVTRMLREAPVGYITYYEDMPYYEDTKNMTELYLNRLRGMTLAPKNRAFEELPAGQKLIGFGKDEDVVALDKRLKDKYSGQINSIVTRPYAHNKVVDFNYTFIEIMTEGVDKSSTLAELAELRGFTIKNVMAFGDDVNDMGMLKAAGWGVAMGNGRDVVKKIADDTCLWHDEDGVAHYIEKYLL